MKLKRSRALEIHCETDKKAWELVKKLCSDLPGENEIGTLKHFEDKGAVYIVVIQIWGSSK